VPLQPGESGNGAAQVLPVECRGDDVAALAGLAGDIGIDRRARLTGLGRDVSGLGGHGRQVLRPGVGPQRDDLRVLAVVLLISGHDGDLHSVGARRRSVFVDVPAPGLTQLAAGTASGGLASGSWTTPFPLAWAAVSWRAFVACARVSPKRAMSWFWLSGFPAATVAA